MTKLLLISMIILPFFPFIPVFVFWLNGCKFRWVFLSLLAFTILVTICSYVLVSWFFSYAIISSPSLREYYFFAPLDFFYSNSLVSGTYFLLLSCVLGGWILKTETREIGFKS